MRNKFEQILLSVLWGMSVLLGLTFWLNTRFGFNVFLIQHWQDLSVLQATQTPISVGFYLSFCIAIFVFLVGIYIILGTHNTTKTIKTVTTTTTITTKETLPAQEQVPEQIPYQAPAPDIRMTRPPKLNLPNNMAQIAANHHVMEQNQSNIPSVDNTKMYDVELAEIFTDNAYIVKPDVIISGFKTNLFAIGNNEVVWVGAVNCDLDKFKQKIEKLKNTFKETLEDIPITVYSFVLDTLHKYDSNQQESNLFIFHSIDELKQFISQAQGADVKESDQENFDAYSEYIDKIIKYIKNI